MWTVDQLAGPGSACRRKQLEVNNLKTQVYGIYKKLQLVNIYLKITF